MNITPPTVREFPAKAFVDIRARAITQDLPRFETAEDIAARLKDKHGVSLSATRIRELAESGHMPCWRIDGGPPLFQRDSVKAYILEELASVQEGAPFPRELQIVNLASIGTVDRLALPQELHCLAAHIHVFEQFNLPSCVYFLVRQRRVVYVGQTVKLAQRTVTHQGDKDFDAVYFILVPRADLDAVEAAFIRALKPPLNNTMPSIRHDNDAALLAAFDAEELVALREATEQAAKALAGKL